jgi:murein L,D-transpeptidase YafK
MRCFHFLGVLLTLTGISEAGAASDGLPMALIRVPESVPSIFIAEVQSAQFHRFEQADGALVYTGSFYMSIGQAGAGKERTGDKRTPIGIYFVTEQLDTSRLHEKYGVTAFPLDYPNAWDRRADRSGDGIWVHGVDPAGGKRPENDTEGCIALPNEDLLALAPEFEHNITPVIVTREITWAAENENDTLRAELEQSINAWAKSQASGDLFAYLSSYDDEFRRWGLGKPEWASLALQSAGNRDVIDVTVSDLLLLRYPDDGIYLSRFQFDRVANGAAVETMKRLYWRRDDSGTLKIIAENDG